MSKALMEYLRLEAVRRDIAQRCEQARLALTEEDLLALHEYLALPLGRVLAEPCVVEPVVFAMA